MTTKYRRRDLTIGLRHKDGGLVVQAKQKNRRARHVRPGSCPDCGAPGMGDAVYDPPVPDTDGRCQTCGTL